MKKISQENTERLRSTITSFAMKSFAAEEEAPKPESQIVVIDGEITKVTIRENDEDNFAIELVSGKKVLAKARMEQSTDRTTIADELIKQLLS